MDASGGESGEDEEEEGEGWSKGARRTATAQTATDLESGRREWRTRAAPEGAAGLESDTGEHGHTSAAPGGSKAPSPGERRCQGRPGGGQGPAALITSQVGKPWRRGSSSRGLGQAARAGPR